MDSRTGEIMTAEEAERRKQEHPEMAAFLTEIEDTAQVAQSNKMLSRGQPFLSKHDNNSPLGKSWTKIRKRRRYLERARKVTQGNRRQATGT